MTRCPKCGSEDFIGISTAFFLGKVPNSNFIIDSIPISEWVVEEMFCAECNYQFLEEEIVFICDINCVDNPEME